MVTCTTLTVKAIQIFGSDAGTFIAEIPNWTEFHLH